MTGKAVEVGGLQRGVGVIGEENFKRCKGSKGCPGAGGDGKASYFEGSGEGKLNEGLPA